MPGFVVPARMALIAAVQEEPLVQAHACGGGGRTDCAKVAVGTRPPGS